MKRVVVIGAGMGGLTASLRLARAGFDVLVVEARRDSGGLASGFQMDGFVFDAGPYILLDRPGLEWAFDAVGLNLAERVSLRRIEDVYEVSGPGATLRFYASAEQTAAGFDGVWPGSGRRYLKFVAEMARIYANLQPLLTRSQPGIRDLLRLGAWKQTRFLTRSLGSVLRAAALPEPVQQAIAIWTHIAGQPASEAPSPMAFVPALIHNFGCFSVSGGIGSIPQALTSAAVDAGVRFRFATPVRTIQTRDGRVHAVETGEGERIEAAAVVSNCNAIGTYLDLLDSTPRDVRGRLLRLPLQSPGVCAYLALKGTPRAPYLRFLLPENARCRLLIAPGVLNPELARDGWFPARLLGPMDYAEAERLGARGQQQYVERLVEEGWWRENAGAFRVLATRTPTQWGSEFHLFRNSMNPVMTARFMRQGRFAHRSPHIRGLYLAGSSTHPGQWVSFCAISGVLAANCAIEDLPASTNGTPESGQPKC
ncbi:MAG TPA: NAD(P)/FAD-dependent oxidoreductase [Candidatus Acidoferrales bacterium]|nr:NAD(P)/FAD-dependent oxidoreductase [Candidatus Acidoferrales bacterium]